MTKRLKTVFKNSFKKHSKQCWIWQGRFLKLEQLQNRCNEEKRKEKKKERGEGKEEKRKKAMAALVVFIIATLEIVLAEKIKLLGAKGPFSSQ